MFQSLEPERMNVKEFMFQRNNGCFTLRGVQRTGQDCNRQEGKKNRGTPPPPLLLMLSTDSGRSVPPRVLSQSDWPIGIPACTVEHPAETAGENALLNKQYSHPVHIQYNSQLD